ncbi:hypothetical protein BLNAU_4887 [Blattamonas nauphoetae]|uniref:Transmembrane protein n=1 Tax=Blattamonas nauphoetae TaxID=2049346 RepID=A0ABQ9Y8L7_9EUKA|nr:hypothetical protein BLNAU_4887 [Blattamonas nauphoetae]
MLSHTKTHQMHSVPTVNLQQLEDRSKFIRLHCATSFLAISRSILLIVLVIIGPLQFINIKAPSELFFAFAMICTINTIVSGYIVFKANQFDENKPVCPKGKKSRHASSDHSAPFEDESNDNYEVSPMDLRSELMEERNLSRTETPTPPNECTAIYPLSTDPSANREFPEAVHIFLRTEPPAEGVSSKHEDSKSMPLLSVMNFHKMTVEQLKEVFELDFLLVDPF